MVLDTPLTHTRAHTRASHSPLLPASPPPSSSLHIQPYSVYTSSPPPSVYLLLGSAVNPAPAFSVVLTTKRDNICNWKHCRWFTVIPRTTLHNCRSVNWFTTSSYCNIVHMVLATRSTGDRLPGRPFDVTCRSKRI